MASSGGIRAGQAFVELLLRDRNLRTGLKSAQRRLKAFGAGVARIGLGISSIATAAFAPLGISALKAAADAEESLTRFRQVFGTETSAAARFAEDLANKVGRSALSIKDGLGVFQSFFVGLGFGGQQARGLSQDMSALLLDFASFNNISDAEGLQRFISALSGSSEVLDRFGINIRQAALQQELLRMGINRSWTEITEQEKALARVNIIMRAMGAQGAVGDAVRTAGSWTNQMKRLNGELLDTRVAIGNVLKQALLPVLHATVSVVEQLRAWIQANPQLTATIFGVGAAAIALGGILIGVGIAASLAGGTMGFFATMTKFAGLALAFVVSPVGLVVAAVAGLGAAIVYYSGAGGAAVDWLMQRFGQLKGFVMDVVGGITDALAAGDIALAAEILWLSLQLAWQKGAASLKEVWSELWHGSRVIMEDAVHAMTKTWIDGTHLWKTLWADLMAGLQTLLAIGIANSRTKLAKFRGLLDETFNVEDATRNIGEDLRSELIEIGTKAESDTDEEKARHAAAVAKENAAHEVVLEKIGDDLVAQTSDTQAALDAALAALDAAKAEAKAARENAPKINTPSLSDALDKLDRLKDLSAADLSDKVSVRGTFNAAAIQGLAAGGPEERTAKATEETAKNTRRIVDQILANGGLTFA